MRDPSTGNSGVPIITNILFSTLKRKSGLPFPKIFFIMVKILGHKEMFILEFFGTKCWR
jgi:hypothetical protein